MILFKRAMTEVSLDLIKFRLQQISTINCEKKISNVPATYIQANQDLLISPKTIAAFKDTYNKFCVSNVDGSHFVLQTNPQSCWEEVIKVERLGELA